MYGQLLRTQQKHQVALEVLMYHWCVTDSEVQKWRNSVTSCSLPNDFYKYVYSFSWVEKITIYDSFKCEYNYTLS